MFEIHEPVIYYKSSENMEELKDDSIQLIITSPPYGKIKDYGFEGQIGYYDSFEEYFERLKQVWRECYRVLEPKCRMIINIGDQYLRTSKFGRYHILSISSKIVTDCLSLGFDFLGDIIWQKISTTNPTGGCSLMGSIYYPRNGLLTFDYEHILIFKKHKGKGRNIDLKVKELSKISLSEWKKWYVGHWKFPGKNQKEHIAMFPEELPYRIIRMFSFIGDSILDPFVGSGTTLKVAKSLFRKGIGFELNENFRETIDNKINEAKIDYFNDYQFLIYKIFQKAKNEKLRILYEKQKQKGIIIIENHEKNEIILDYILFDLERYNETSILKEIELKFEENSVQNYLNKKEGWSQYTNYIIVINSSFSHNQKFIDLIKKNLKNLNLQKPIQFILFESIISREFQLSNLFDVKHININLA
ncbi:MAG: DNA-methyltransferase [Candidatus Hodarchaeota archaeon]